jgi:uncharacterized membrane protein YoaK (UPF0700 family)
VHRYRQPMIAAAVLLAMLGGFVDALAYLGLGGFFASFMSGNTTRLGIGLAAADMPSLLTAGALILSFISGVMIATVVAIRFESHRKVAVMVCVTLLLTLAASLARVTTSHVPLILLATAMGAENGVFTRDGEVSIGVTYMSGNLVKLGQKLAGALLGMSPTLGWMPHLFLWLGFASGAIMGGRAHVVLGNGALSAAAGASAVLTLLITALRGHQSGTNE